MRLFNFKKISALVTSALLVGLTAGTGVAAANYPTPFVSGGSADVAIVYGTGSGVSSSDRTQAEAIESNLQTFITGSSGDSSSVTGDSVRLAKTTDDFNVGDTANTFFASGIDGDDLTVVLAEGLYRDDGNDQYDYEQEIDMGSSVTLAHFQDSEFNDDEPVLGFEITDGTHVLNYTLDFTPDNAESSTADWNELEGTTISMLGKEYYILSASNATASAETLELLDSANSGTVSGTETVTVEAGGSSYQVSIAYIDSDEVRLIVNGETTPSLNEKDTYRLDSGDYVGVKDIGFQGVTGGKEFAEFSIGSGKIELTNGEEIQINAEDISDSYDHVLTAYVTNSGEDLDSISIAWTVDDDMWLGFGTNSRELVMPAFGNVKLSLGNFVTSAQEVTSIDPDGDSKLKIDTTVTDGDVNFNFLYANSTGTHFNGIGKDSDELLTTAAGTQLTWTTNSKWFVASWRNGDDFESYVLEVEKPDDSKTGNTTTIKSMATGSNKAVTLDIDDTEEIGEISFTLNGAWETNDSADITIAAAGGSGSVNLSQIITEEGLWIQLPYAITAASGGQGTINVNASSFYKSKTWVMNFDEEDKDGDIKSGEEFNITLGFSSGETTVSSINENSMSGDADLETSDGSDNFRGYQKSDLATMTLFKTGGDQDSIDITYHGSEAYGQVYLSETGSVVSGGSAGNLIVTDSEITSVQSKNLIVVGGSCINSVAANLLGGPSRCEGDWTTVTDVGSGEWLIQSFASPYTSGKVAVLVAGYDAADTVAAASALRTETIDTSAGNKYVGPGLLGIPFTKVA